MTLRDNEKMEDDDIEDLFDKKDIRSKRDKKRVHKQSKDKGELAKESFKRMKEEIDEMRKREADRQKELDDLRKKIEEQTNQQHRQTSRNAEPEFALEFNREMYLKKGFIESAKWIKETLAKNMLEKMNDEKNKSRFEAMIIAKKKCAYLGARACARYNRGEECMQGRWHTSTKHEPTRDRGGQPHLGEGPSQHPRVQRVKKEELRIHACTLCLEVFGAAFGHSVLDCPWIMKKNWMN